MINLLGTPLINQFGWRDTLSHIMVTMSMLRMLPFTALILRIRPSEIGVLPYGQECAEAEKDNQTETGLKGTSHSKRIVL